MHVRSRGMIDQESDSNEAHSLLPTATPPAALECTEGDVVQEATLLRKLNHNLLFKLCCVTLLCYIDRTNLAFAALQLNQDLGFSPYVYGIGSSVFFIGYAAFQVPSNLALVRYGAPMWLGGIVTAWGLSAALFAFMRSTTQFYALRLLLGVAEAGTMPGIWYTCHQFYTDKEFPVAFSYVLTGAVLSQVLGAPLAAGLLALDGVLGLRGWQWLFLVEGLPTIVLGLYLRATLPACPMQASFLSEQERSWLHRRHSRTKDEKAASGADLSIRGALQNWRTWYIAGINVLDGIVKYSLIFWAPLIVSSIVKAGQRGTSEPAPALVALLTVVPFGLAAGSMLLVSKHSQKTGEQRLHLAASYAVLALCLALLSHFMSAQSGAAFLMLTLATMAAWGSTGVLAACPATFLHGPAAATGVATINSVAQLGGLIGPYLLGALKQSTGTYDVAVMVLAAVAAANCVAAYLFRSATVAIIQEGML